MVIFIKFYESITRKRPTEGRIATVDGMENFLQLEENLRSVESRIAAAALRSNRTPEEIRLLPVTKNVGTEVIRALESLGYSEMAESRPQALTTKAASMTESEIRWVMIGHLQTNKARQVVPIVKEVQSVDSLRVATALSRLSQAPISILLQVNISAETTKTGFNTAEMPQVLQQIAALPNLHVRGLMTIAQNSSDNLVVRSTFHKLRKLRDSLSDLAIPGVSLDELSMGMSGDFEIAIEEGSTTIRLGSILFRGLI